MITERNIIARASALGWKSEHLGDEADSDAAFDWLCDRVGELVQFKSEEKTIYDGATEAIRDGRETLERIASERDDAQAKVAELEGDKEKIKQLAAKAVQAGERRVAELEGKIANALTRLWGCSRPSPDARDAVDILAAPTPDAGETEGSDGSL